MFLKLIVKIILFTSIIVFICKYISIYIKLNKSKGSITFKDLLLKIDTILLVENLYKRWEEQVRYNISKDIYVNQFTDYDICSPKVIKKIDEIVLEKSKIYIDKNSIVTKKKFFNYIEELKEISKTPNKYNVENYMFTIENTSNLKWLRLINIKKFLFDIGFNKTNLFYLYTSIDKKLLNNNYSDIDIVCEIIFQTTEKLNFLLN